MLSTACVKNWMTTPPITIPPSLPLRTAYDMMVEMGIRHLPVVDGTFLVGILTMSDIRDAKPSDATSLSVWELTYLWDQLTVERIMTTKVVTTRPGALVVDAVETMLNNKFSGLPVVNDAHHVVGFLSQIDIYRLLVQTAREEAQPDAQPHFPRGL
jgi:CBS domain-containing protein